MRDSKFTIVIDILGIIALWMIAIGTMWQVYYTRLVYLQNNQAMVSQSTVVTPPSINSPSTSPDSTGPNDYYMVPIPPSVPDPNDSDSDSNGSWVPLDSSNISGSYNL